MLSYVSGIISVIITSPFAFSNWKVYDSIHIDAFSLSAIPKREGRVQVAVPEK